MARRKPSQRTTANKNTGPKGADAAPYAGLWEFDANCAALLEQMRDGVVILQDGVCRYANAAAAAMGDYEIEDIIGKPFLDFATSESKEAMLDGYRKRMEGEPVPPLYEASLLRNDGTALVAEISASIVGYEGRLADMAVLRDITERKQAEARLMTVLERNEAIVQSLGDIVYEWRPHSDELSWSGDYTRVLGYSPEEMGNDTESWTSRIHPDDLERAMTEVDNASNERRAYDLEYRFRDKSGGYRWMYDRGMTFVDEEGVLERIIGVFKDITERKQAEEALRDSEEELQVMFDGVRDGIAVLDTTGRLVKVNRRIIDVGGYTEEELLGQPLDSWEVFKPGYLEVMIDAFSRGMSGEEVTPFEVELHTKDGQELTVEVYGCPLTRRGQWVGAVATMRNATQRKRAEKALRESEERYRGLFQLAPNAIFTVDTDGNITASNSAALELTGYPESELVGRNFAELPTVPTEDIATYADMLDALRKGQMPEPFEALFYDKSGSERWGEVHVGPIAAGDKVTGVQVVTRDITDHRRAEEALRESEKRYRELFDNTLDGAVVVDLESASVLLANRAASELYGSPSPDDIYSISPLDYIHPDDRDRAVKVMMEDMFEKDLRQINEFRTFTRDGRERWVSAIGACIEYDGKKAGLGIFRDITDQKQAEEALRQSEEKFSKAFHATSNLMGISTVKEGRVVDINEAYARLVGYEREYLIGHPTSEFGIWADPEQREMVVRKLEEEGQVRDLELEIRTKFGEVRTVLFSADTIALGSEPCLINMAIDITERKQAEEALRRAKEFTESLIASMRDGLSVLDSQGVHIDVNPAFCEMTGFSQEEIIGVGMPHPYWPPEEYEDIERAFQKTVKRECHDFQLTFMRKSGERFPVIVSPSIVTDERGNAISYYATVKDITEHKQLEAERQRADKLESVGTLAGGIAHDFNNLLTGIMGNIGLAQRYIDRKSEAYDVLEEAERASLEARGLTQQLLTFAKGGTPVKELASIRDVVVDSATFALRGSTVKCCFDMPDDIWAGEIDVGRSARSSATW